MKKIFVKVLFCIFIIAGLCSCGNKAKIDENGFFYDLDDAKKVAEKNDKNILLLLTSEGDDFASEDFLNNVVKTQEFTDTVAKDNVVVLFDFSQKSFEKTVVNPEATKKEQKAAEEYGVQMQKNFTFVNKLNIQVTPSIFYLTKEGYCIDQIRYYDGMTDASVLQSMIETLGQESLELRTMIDATKTGSNLEKVTAIDNLLKTVNPEYTILMQDLMEKIPELDKSNESGLVAEYIVALADLKVMDFYVNNDAFGAVQCYTSIFDNEYLDAEQKQYVRYMAAYMLLTSGSTEYGVVIKYLQDAVKINPDGEYTPMIQEFLNYVVQTIESFETTQQDSNEMPTLQ